jgi:uncharacterized protein YndB with AHSA1/START domain
MIKPLVFHGSVRINAPAATVWRVLTTPALTKKFMFGGEAMSDWKTGSPLVWRTEGSEKVLRGSIVAIETGKLLSYTIINPEADYPDIPANASTVTYTLVEEDGVTTVSVSDGDFASVADGKERYRLTLQGWEVALVKLKEVVEDEFTRGQEKKAMTVDEFVAVRVRPEFKPVVAMLRELMRETAPGAKEVISYGIPAYRGKKMLAAINPTKHYVTFGFARGAEFEDPYGLLRGEGHVSKHVRIRNLDEVNKDALCYYIRQAVYLDEKL